MNAPGDRQRLSLRLCRLISIVAIGGCSSMGGSSVKTLGRVDTNTSESRSWFLAASPSILQYERSDRVAADLATAIAHYDAIAQSAVDSDTRAEAARRAAYLRLKESEETADDATLDMATRGYEELLARQPADTNNDLALYQLARAYQNAGRMDQADEWDDRAADLVAKATQL